MMSARFNKFCLYLMICLLTLGQLPLSARAQDMSLDLLESYEAQRRATADMMERATVWVIADGRRTISSGSGFCVAPGYIMTNAHVVDGEENMDYYIMNEFLPLTSATLVNKAYDRRSESGADFALLRFTPPAGSNMPVLSFNLDVKRMDRVSAWGYPDMITRWDSSVRNMRTNIRNIQGAPPVVYTEGTVSTLVSNRGSSIIHTASIAAGNSGGPLVNHRGEVVGINTWGYTEEGEGAFINASLTASEIVTFLRNNGVEPRIAQTPNTYVAYIPDDSQSSPQPDQQQVSPPPQPSPTPPAPVSSRPLWLEIAMHTGSGDFSAFYPAPEAAPTSPADNQGQAGTSLAEVPEEWADANVTSAQARGVLNAALAGDVGQMYEVGRGYMDGSNGFPQDKGRAFSWLKQASDLGSDAAQGMLGMLYLLDADMRNPALGMEYLRKCVAAPNPDPQIMDFLAMVLYQGEYLGVKPDAAESFVWAQKAAAAGNPSSQALLGFHYLDGKAAPRDLDKALEYAQASADAGSSMGKALLATIYFQGREFQDNPQQVIALAEEAAAAGEPAAQGLLARIYAFEDAFVDLPKAERYARLAAGNANALGQYVLGWLYMTGNVVEQNIPMAWAYLQYTHNRLDDLGVDPHGPLLVSLERGITQRQRLRGQQIQNSWQVAWGFAQ